VRINEVTKIILDKSIEIHRTLGPGLLESIYEKALIFELTSADLKVESQKSIDVQYKSITMEAGFRLDLLVEEKVIIELKSVEQLQKVHFAQLLTYLKLTNLEVGLLINFNVPLLKDGFHRLVNQHKDYN